MLMKKLIITLVLLLAFSQIDSNAKQPDFAKFKYFKTRYGSKCLSEKITDNFGKGYDSLYGTRNLRVILHGVAYRGGANNVYNKNTKRDNQNPLPEEGLKNLANQGYSAAYYLYGKNFSSASKYKVGKKGDTLKYYMNTCSNTKQLTQIIKDVYDVIYTKGKGPVYLHCWNGWHMSGYISAVLLKQYCKFSDEAAVKYWEKNTDNNHTKYEHIKKKIREFTPLKEYTIDEETRKAICPCNK